MYGQNLQQLQRHNAKFALNASPEEQKQQVFALVLKDPSVVEFDLMMAKSAYQGWIQQKQQYESYKKLPGYKNNMHLYFPFGCPTTYLPSPETYLSSIDARDLNNFFGHLVDVSNFVHKLLNVAQQLTSKKRVEDAAHLIELVKKRDTEKFFQLLHFTLLTNPMHLSEMNTPWYNEIPCTKVQVFHCSYTAAEEVAFARNGSWNAVLYHGTFEHNVYSIMRNGIQNGATGAVFMSSDINTSLAYARSANKVILCLEVRARDSTMQGYLSHCSFQPSQLMLRAIIWIAADSVSQTKSVATKTIQEIKKKQVQG